MGAIARKIKICFRKILLIAFKTIAWHETLNYMWWNFYPFCPSCHMNHVIFQANHQSWSFLLRTLEQIHCNEQIFGGSREMNNLSFNFELLRGREHCVQPQRDCSKIKSKPTIKYRYLNWAQHTNVQTIYVWNTYSWCESHKIQRFNYGPQQVTLLHAKFMEFFDNFKINNVYVAKSRGF